MITEKDINDEIEEIDSCINTTISLHNLEQTYKKLLKKYHPDENVHEDSNLYTKLCQHLQESYKEKLIKLSKIHEKDPEIIIPEVNNGCIDEGYHWDKGVSTISNIFIPNTVYKIRKNAFRNVRWTILEFEERKDDTPVFIAPGAFSQYSSKDISSQTIINIPQYITYSSSLSYYTPFNYCNIKCFQMYSGTKYEMKFLYPQVTWAALNDITEITKRMFHDCEDLIKVSDTENVTLIEEEAFKNCYNLEELFLPNIKDIKIGSLSGCNKVKIKTHKYQISRFKKAFGDSIENHLNQFIEL